MLLILFGGGGGGGDLGNLLHYLSVLPNDVFCSYLIARQCSLLGAFRSHPPLCISNDFVLPLSGQMLVQ